MNIVSLPIRMHLQNHVSLACVESCHHQSVVALPNIKLPLKFQWPHPFYLFSLWILALASSVEALYFSQANDYLF